MNELKEYLPAQISLWKTQVHNIRTQLSAFEYENDWEIRHWSVCTTDKRAIHTLNEIAKILRGEM